MIDVEIRGLQLEMNEQMLFDADVADMIYDIYSGTIPPVKRLVVALFGNAQYKRIQEALRDEYGIVRIDTLADFFTEAVQAANLKKS